MKWRHKTTKSKTKMMAIHAMWTMGRTRGSKQVQGEIVDMDQTLEVARFAFFRMNRNSIILGTNTLEYSSK